MAIDDKAKEDALIYYENNIINRVNNNFIELTGYTYDDVKERSSQELSKLLRIYIDSYYKDNKNEYKAYIFTKDDQPKFIKIIHKYLDDKSKKVCFTLEPSNIFLQGLLANCINMEGDKKRSEAFYTYPSLIHLKTNDNYLDKLKTFSPQSTKVIGYPYSPIHHIMDYLKESSYYFKEAEKFIDKDGNSKYLTIKANIIDDGYGLSYLKLNILDETEKVLSKKSIEKQTLEMETILESIPHSIIKLNKDGEYEYTNKLNLHKLSPYISNGEQLNNKKVYECFKYNDINGRELSFDETPDVRVLNGETLTNYTIIGTSHLPTTYHECSGTPIYDDEGNVDGAVLVYKDIENIFKVEEYNTLADSIKNLDIDYVTMSAIDFKINYINNTGMETIKKTHSHINSVIGVIGKNFFDFYTEDVEERKEVISNIRRAIKNGSNKYIHTRKFIQDGKVDYVKTIFQTIFDDNNNIEKISSIGMYITDEESANRKMANSLKAQEEIFVNTSHELKTPINLIFSASQLSKLYLNNDCKLDIQEKLKNNNQIIIQNCYRTIKLINNIIDVSRMEQGFYELSLENKNIVNVVEDIVASVSNYIKDNKLEIIFDPHTEEKIIALDLYKFERVMLNLISNAIKFSKDEGIILISLIDRESTVEISVKDQGIGIDDENKKCIFNKFKQENKSLNRNVEGTGIGLSLVKSIVELHKGSVDLKSTVGVGSEFIINLPSKTVDNPVINKEELIFKNRVEMIKFEFSDIYD